MSERRRELSGNFPEDGFPIKTLFIRSDGEKLTCQDLLVHFSTFGNVHNVRIDDKCSAFGFVTFARAESAAEVLAIQHHTIAGYRTTVEIAERLHQDDESHNNLSYKLINATDTQFLDLNDDCLYKIFSLDRLTIIDLCSIAETSIRLKKIADQVFTRRHEAIDFDFDLETSLHHRRILLNFGSLISELRIWEFTEKGTHLMDVIIECCSSTLESLVLCHCKIDVTVQSKPLFNKLRKLAIGSSTFTGDTKDLFANCESLVQLEIDNLDYIQFTVKTNFPKLEQFTYYSNNADDNVHCLEDLEEFISRHKNLQDIRLVDIKSTCSLNVIADHCKEVEKLRIAIGPRTGTVDYEKIIKGLQMLEHLKGLVINCHDENVTQIIEKLNSLKYLESLELRNVRMDSRFIVALSQLKNLHILRLIICNGLVNLNEFAVLDQLTELVIQYDGKQDFDLVYIIKHLINLKTLTLYVDKFSMDKGMYIRIVDVVRGRSGSAQHSLTIRCFKANDGVYDLQFHGDNRQVVKLV